jgi:polar amino acid transport system substrate-binding protein
MHKLAAAGVTGAAALALVLSGCSANASSDPSSSADASAPLASAVPSEFKGGITVAMSTNNPPLSMQQAGQTVGEDPDLLDELSKVLGIKITKVPTSFENELLGLDQGKFDFVVQTDITKARLAKYDQLAQFKDGYTYVTTSDNKDIGKDASDVCGKTIATQTGANNTADLATQSATCEKDGKAAIKIVALPDVPSLYLAVASGRADAASAATSTLGYFLSSDQDKLGKKWRFTGPSYLEGKVGWTFPKGSKLIDAVQKGITYMMDKGTYQDVLTKWGLKNNIADKAEINPSIG